MVVSLQCHGGCKALRRLSGSTLHMSGIAAKPKESSHLYYTEYEGDLSKVAEMERRLAPLKSKMVHHSLWSSISTQQHVQAFTEVHAFAVWDFMSLLKALQRGLTCVEVDWRPPRLPQIARFINEIVLDEEADVIPQFAHPISHAELYVQAMREVGADTTAIIAFLETLRHGGTASSPHARIAIVSICAYAESEVVRQVGQENHAVYAQLHGYDMFDITDASQISPNQGAAMDVNDGVHKPFFWKVNAVKNVLELEPRYDWVLWIDCDAFFMDPARTIDSVIQMYAGNWTAASRLGPEQLGEPAELRALRQRLHPMNPTEVSLIVATDSTGINNGVWLMRNSPWSHDFLTRWWHSDILQGPGKNHNCSDQSTMQHQLLYANSITIDAEWDAVEGPLWVPEVRVAAQEHLQSFHAATAYTVASREWQEGDFIKHHPGCHYYKLPCQQLYLQAHEIFVGKVRALTGMS